MPKIKPMDYKLLINQHNSIALTLISPVLYEVRGDDMAYLHSDQHHDLFFIHLNEYLNTTFNSPLDNTKRVSIFTLMIDLSEKYKGNESFDYFLKEANHLHDYFFKNRYYRYYVSPHEIDFEISFAELIRFQANYSKHSLYHLDVMKKNLKKIFEKNQVPDFAHEDYNDHLVYLKEFVLDDRLNFNTTHFIEKLGKFFLAYHNLINSSDNTRIRQAINNCLEEHGRPLIGRKVQPPENMSEVEKFHWEIRFTTRFDRERLEKFIPETSKYLIEQETSLESPIIKI